MEQPKLYRWTGCKSHYLLDKLYLVGVACLEEDNLIPFFNRLIIVKKQLNLLSVGITINISGLNLHFSDPNTENSLLFYGQHWLTTDGRIDAEKGKRHMVHNGLLIDSSKEERERFYGGIDIEEVTLIKHNLNPFGFYEPS